MLVRSESKGLASSVCGYLPFGGSGLRLRLERSERRRILGEKILAQPYSLIGLCGWQSCATAIIQLDMGDGGDFGVLAVAKLPTCTIAKAE